MDCQMWLCGAGLQPGSAQMWTACVSAPYSVTFCGRAVHHGVKNSKDEGQNEFQESVFCESNEHFCACLF